MKFFNIRRQNYKTYLLTVLTSAVIAFPAGASESSEKWSRVEVGGIPAGWVHEAVTRGPQEHTSEAVFHLEVRRGSAEIMFEMSTRFVETPDGHPIEAWSRQLLGALPIETTWTFQEDGVRRATRQGDAPERVDVIPVPAGEWLTPGRLEQALREHLAADSESFTLRLLDPTLGLQVTETSWVREARETTVEIDGVEHVVSRWQQSQSLIPNVTSTVDLSADGVVLRTRTAMMGLEMSIVASSREKIFGALDTQRESGLPELLIRSFISPDRAVPNPREARRATYRLSAESVLAADDLPSTASQRVRQDGDAVRVIVDLEASENEDLPDRAPHLAASTWLDHRAASVAELVQRALGTVDRTEIDRTDADRTDVDRAETLRRFVSEHVDEKNLNTVMATATEVARTGAGDCTEHAVLLSAMLRGAGIPSRVATGLVYAERFAGESEIFVYHMWSQAYLDGRWTDLDATLVRPFDAAHIALAVTALEDDLAALTSMAHLTSLMGSLHIEVLEEVSEEVLER